MQQGKGDEGDTQGLADDDDSQGLVDDVLRHIFRLLPPSDLATCMRVCRQWRRLVTHSAHLLVTHFNGRFDPAIVLRVFGQHIRDLDLRMCERHEIVELAVVACTNVERVDLRLCGQTERFTVLFRNCPRLKHFHASLATHRSVQKHFVFPTDAICRDLEVLELCRSYHPESLRKNTSSVAPMDPVESLFNARSMVVSAFCEHVHDTDLIAISAVCPNLRELYISGCSRVTHSGVETILSACRHLRILDVSFCILLNDDAIAHFTQRFPHVFVYH